MKTLLGLLALAGLTVSAQPTAKERLLERIEAIAVSEPPVLGVDTQIRTAATLASKDPDLAERWLQAATSRALPLVDLHTRGEFLIAIVDQYRQLDTEAAEQVCSLLPRRATGAKEDPLARCYHSLFSVKRSWEEEKALTRRALSAGAFLAPEIRSHLERSIKEHPEECAAEFAVIVEGFPAADASPQERRHLLDMANLIRKREPELAAAARKLAESKPKAPAAGTEEELEKKQVLGEEKPPTEGLATPERISLARKQTPAMQVEMLLEVMDGDKELSPPQRIALAYEALEVTPKIKAGDERLVSQSMLARRLYDYGDRGKAAVAAQMLAESFEKFYNCETAACVAFEGDSSPGEVINDFAEYLRENKIQPEDLGLRHKSLEARLLILDLQQSLGIEKKRFSFF
ncbi:hypothetical protein [Paludibaculum fermentans]|uniref:HEAT repeat domain-containing protein n=1 Tax=Paludibaculum fermentans TaxID=1473598 RepID=A0A7S7NKK5_PALFE|nr:hypothetical protein [Paludibaculum fermentans]QOY85302.1 hypothetical protein IRI77_20955 [Paludibaculum fermentans]